MCFNAVLIRIGAHLFLWYGKVEDIWTMEF